MQDTSCFLKWIAYAHSFHMCHLLPSQGKKLAKILMLGPTEAGALLVGRGVINAGSAVEGLCRLGSFWPSAIARLRLSERHIRADSPLAWKHQPHSESCFLSAWMQSGDVWLPVAPSSGFSILALWPAWLA